MKKTLRLYFTDWGNNDPADNLFTNILKHRYNIIIDEENPDFLIHSCYSNNKRKYACYIDNHYKYDCIKIFYTAENDSPNFNISDYAIAFDHINLDDRYFRWPFFRWDCGHEYTSENPTQRKFCNFLSSKTSYAHPARSEIFQALSTYKQVDSGGSLFNNIGKRIENKFLWQQEYKFSLTCENSSVRGYTTEKIYHALQANTVPIYWGNPLIEKDFSKNCFINAMDFSSLNELVDYVKYLDQNDEAYLQMLNAPYLPEDICLKYNSQKYPAPVESEDFKQFLFNIFDQEPHQARRRPIHGFSPDIQRRIRRMHLRYATYRKVRDIIRRPYMFTKDAIKKFLKI